MVLFLYGQMLLEFVVLGYVWKSLTSSLDILMIKASVCEVESSWDTSKMGPAAHIYKN